jgi:hypothetical protein
VQKALSRGRTLGVPIEWVVLGSAMALSVALILCEGRGTTLFADDIEYFAHLQKSAGEPAVVDFSLRYVLAPFNGHLQAVGKLVYEAMLGLFGSDYLPFRILEALLWSLCVGLFYALVRPLVGVGAALAGSVLLLFLGSSWEAMLWAFDLHELIALAAGLGALLVLRRGGRRADAATCALLLLAVGSIELGLAFAVGIGVGILMRADRWSRIWIVAVPIVLYGAWTLWAHQYEQQQLDLLASVRAIVSIPSSLSVTVGSLTGLIDPSAGVSAMRLGSTFESRLVAVLVAVLVVRRISRGRISDETWVTLTVLLAFWAFITIGVRPPDQTRFVFPQGLLLLLVIAGLFAGKRASIRLTAVLFFFVALALPTNLAVLADGRTSQMTDAIASRSQYAMIELARDHVDPDYSANSDERVRIAADRPFTALTAGEYLPAADRYGGIGYSLAEVRALDERPRLGADATLVGALDLQLRGTEAPADRSACSRIDGSLAAAAQTELAPGGAIVRAVGRRSAALYLTRFSDSPEGVSIGRTRAGWVALEIPTDAASASDPWTLLSTGAIEVCPIAGGGDTG